MAVRTEIRWYQGWGVQVGATKQNEVQGIAPAIEFLLGSETVASQSTVPDILHSPEEGLIIDRNIVM